VKSHFWETGNFTSIVYVPQTGDTIDDVRHIGVLLDPAAIQAILNSHGVAAAPEAMPAIAAPADPPIEQNAPEERQPDKERAAAIAKPKGTVNPTMLASWFAVFAQAFPEERNADRIWEAAKTFFCDREVPRSRMRPAMDKVMGKRARGRRATPKSDDAAN
jgi:hypothetical protein